MLVVLLPSNVFWRIQEKLRSGELSVSGDQWPIFLYRSYKFYGNDPWKGLLQSSILVKVSQFSLEKLDSFYSYLLWKTFKHIFTSPSSVERKAKATRSGNARIHGMSSVTLASIVYAATQVWPFMLYLLPLSWVLLEGKVCIVIIKCVQ